MASRSPSLCSYLLLLFVFISGLIHLYGALKRSVVEPSDTKSKPDTSSRIYVGSKLFLTLIFDAVTIDLKGKSHSSLTCQSSCPVKETSTLLLMKNCFHLMTAFDHASSSSFDSIKLKISSKTSK